MINIPFQYGNTVSGNDFTNREAEVLHLKRNFRQGINTTIISPRRWGKSSLVEKVVVDMKGDKKIRIAMLDIFTINSEAEFLEAFARDVIKSSSSKWEDWVHTAQRTFKSIVPRIQFSIDPLNDFSIGFSWQEALKYKDEILNLPEVIAKEKGIKLVICIDEFQNLARLKDFESLEMRMRSVWQRQKEVTYCMYGSIRHMMRDIFNRADKPFYRFSDLIMLEKIKKKKWISFICEGFENTGKLIEPEYAGYIADIMKNHPWYVQQMSQYTWNITRKKTGKKEIEEALERIIITNRPFFEKEIEGLSNTQINLLKAIRKGETKFTSQSVMIPYQLGTSNNVFKNKAILIENDIVEYRDEEYHFMDPVFELWFRRRYL